MSIAKHSWLGKIINMSVTLRQKGFTIVELLIVIVVIAVLAAISIVAYNGIQERTKNSKTHAAVTSWVKAINMYRQANGGSWPPGSNWTCLGEGYKWGPNEVESSSGVPPNHTQCTGSSGAVNFVERENFNNAMRDYVGGSFPTPAMVTAVASGGAWYRGIMFTNIGGSNSDAVSLRVVYAGSLSECPSVTLTASNSRQIVGGNTYCQYSMGLRTDPI